MDVAQYSVKQLRIILRELNAKLSGNKSDLLLRLKSYDDAAISAAISKVKDALIENSKAMADESYVDDSGEDALSQIKGDVATLTQTVNDVLQKLQVLISGSQGVESSMRSSAESSVDTVSTVRRDTNARGPEAGVVRADGGITSQYNAAHNVNVQHDNANVAGTHVSANVGNVAGQQLLGNIVEQHAAGNVAEQRDVLNIDMQHGIRNAGMQHDASNAAIQHGVRNMNMHHDVGGFRGVLRGGGDLSGGGDVREIIRIMPEFNPGKGLTSTMFIERINQLRSVYGWNEQLMLYALYDQLKGVAKHWINSMPIFSSWSEFVHAFLKDFPSAKNTAEVNMQMMRTRISKNESYVDYYYRMLMLGRGGGLEDAAIITYVINGLMDETTKRILSAMYFHTCADLLKTLANIQMNDKKPNIQPQMNAQTSFNNTANGKESYKSGNFNKAKIDIICYRCKEHGHIARHCRKNRGRSDNVNAINNSTSNEPMEVTENSLNNIHVGQCKELLKNVVVTGGTPVQCSALIDSGCGKSIIKKSIAAKCGAQLRPCNNKLLGFAGGEVWCTRKADVVVKCDDVSHATEMLVVDDDTMTYEVILGLDVLSKGTVVITNGVCRIMPISVADVELDMDEGLPQDAVEKLRKVIEKFSHCFGEKLAQLGKSKSFEMEIKLTSTEPIARKPYPISIPQQQVVDQIVSELLEMDIIRPSNSAYSSPILLVKKANGEQRLCVDYRMLNSITEKQPWHMPTVDGVLASLSGNNFFTALDFMSGYYQVAIKEESKQYTAFVTHSGHFEFNRTAFGLRNAPSAFQRLMHKLIAPMRDKVINYVDEIIIATRTTDENIEILSEFLKLVEQEGLTLRVSKCSFLKQTVTFLGHTIDKNGIRPGSKKTEAIRKYPRPTKQQEVRQFLGLASYFRKFVPNFAIIAKPICNLLKKEVTFEWTVQCQEAFDQIKRLLTESPILAVYDIHKEHQLHTDASSNGLAAILMQKEGDVFKPLAYFSRSCTSAESKYHAYELEALAMVEACERFRMYLFGKHFTIVTDCQAIASAKLHTPIISRVARWFLKLMEYDYVLVHRAGDTMKHVDALSRAPISGPVNEVECCAPVMQIETNDWVSLLQQRDPSIKMIMDIVMGKQNSDAEKQIRADYCVRQHRLFRKMEPGKDLLVVPKGVRFRILKLCHDDAGHPGIDGTIKRIKENFWFPRTRNFAKGYIASCIDCSFHRTPQRKECQLYGMEVPQLPFQVLHMDHLGPFVKSKRGNEHILVIVDALTRYAVIVAVKSTKTKPVIDALNALTLQFGLPQKVVTDRGTAFTSAMFEEFCSANGIEHIKVAVRTPRANGLAERVNQAVLAYLKPSSSDAKNWDSELRMLQWTLNTKVNATTKMSAMELIFDFPLRDLSGNKLLTALHDSESVVLSEKRKLAIENINKAREKWKIRFDRKYKTPRRYQVGDLVLIEAPAMNTGESRKLLPVYKGPYQVTKVMRYDRYVVEDLEGQQRSSRRFSTVATTDKMKPWCALYPELDDDFEADEEDITRDE